MYYSKATKKNFEEFNALYKKIDREDCIPDHIASVVLKHIRNTANKSKVLALILSGIYSRFVQA